MPFHDVQFPPSLSFGSIGGPERRTEITTLVNGHEERNTPWAHSRRRFDAGLGLRSLDDVQDLIAFFEARQGQMYGFRWKDWSDYTSAKPSREVTHQDQLLGFGDGERTAFQLVKVYTSGGQDYTRPIAKPRPGTVLVSIAGDPVQEGIDFALDTTTGTVTFDSAPGGEAEIRAGFAFDVPVRFDSDSIQVSVSSFQAGEVPSVPVVEVRI